MCVCVYVTTTARTSSPPFPERPRLIDKFLKRRYHKKTRNPITHKESKKRKRMPTTAKRGRGVELGPTEILMSGRLGRQLLGVEPKVYVDPLGHICCRHGEGEACIQHRLSEERKMASLWEKMSNERPKGGFEIHCPALSAALERQQTFNREEFESLKVTGFRPTSFILATDGSYYRPIGGRAARTCDSCPTTPPSTTTTNPQEVEETETTTPPPPTTADQVKVTPPRRKGDPRHSVAALCLSPCTCLNVYGLGTSYHIDPAEYPQIPDCRADLYTLLETNEAEKKVARGVPQRLAATFTMEDGATSEIWLNENGAVRCAHGHSFKSIRTRVSRRSSTICGCPGQMLGRNGAVLSESGYSRLCIRNGIPESAHRCQKRLKTTTAEIQQHILSKINNPTQTPPPSETSSETGSE